MLTTWQRVVWRVTRGRAVKCTTRTQSTAYLTAQSKSSYSTASLWSDCSKTKMRSRSQCSNASVTKRHYQASYVRYADAIQKKTDATTEGSALQKQLEQVFNLLAVVEEQGPNAEESAREALILYNKILAQKEHLSEDEQASCYDGMGVCYMKLGDTNAAEKALWHGAETHPSFAPLWLHIGEVLQLKGQHLHAVSMFTKFLELSKEFYHSINTRYNVDASAVEYQYTTRTQLPYHRTDTIYMLCAALFKRAVSYIRIPDETMALQDLWLIVDTAHSAHWTSRAYLAIAQLARLRGDWHQARNIATKSIDAAAKDTTQSRDRAQILSQAHHVRAVCYEALEDESRAEQDHVLADFYFRESAYKAS